MKELVDLNFNIDVSQAEYNRLLGYPMSYDLIGRGHELVVWARQWYHENGKPWVHAIEIDDIDFSGENLKIGGVEFTSKKLRDQFAEAQVLNSVHVIVSAGKECEEKAQKLWNEGKPDEYFFLEVFGSAVAEHLVTIIRARLCSWAEENDLTILPHYSPGYLGWNMLDQKRIFDLIVLKTTNCLPGEIKVYETGMLNPKNSMVAVFGITKNTNKARKYSELIPCETCSMYSCQYRRVPYKHSLNQIESVRQLQPIIREDF